MAKILSVVGARPNFMKIAPIAAEISKVPSFQHCLVHSGQHYDELLSGNFFSDLGLPHPDVNLQVGSGSHAVQTAEVMKRLEPVLLDFQPALVLVVGDVNSTLASAITAAKLGIAVGHVEAGLRSFDLSMPEEINRKVVDTISDFLFVSEQSGVENLCAEGVDPAKVFFVGNVMIDTLVRHRAVAAQLPILSRLGLRDNGSKTQPYAVLTLHRPSNVDREETLRGILGAVAEIARDLPVLFPVHPRTRKNISDFELEHLLTQNGDKHGIRPLDPLGYLDFLALNDQARLVLTDSGGIQEETTALGVPCLTLRENTERPATVEYGSNEIVGTDPVRIVAAARSALDGGRRNSNVPPLWDGHAATRIVEILRQKLKPGFLDIAER
jgi:UDP-N-acetylglucosamine 2-epimerase (non-hydrolysing)